jgi:hypothetical protein
MMCRFDVRATSQRDRRPHSCLADDGFTLEGLFAGAKAPQSENLCKVGDSVDLILSRGKRGDEARQDFIGTEFEARICARIIASAGGPEPSIELTRQSDEHEIGLYWPNRRQAYGGKLG